jgi:hypothetical protein
MLTAAQSKIAEGYHCILRRGTNSDVARIGEASAMHEPQMRTQTCLPAISMVPATSFIYFEASPTRTTLTVGGVAKSETVLKRLMSAVGPLSFVCNVIAQLPLAIPSSTAP